ncbi:MAG: hypothetical protein ACLQJR_23085 [Stellaceae bacterium]
MKRHEINEAFLALHANDRARQATPSRDKGRRRRLAPRTFIRFFPAFHNVEHLLLHSEPRVADRQLVNACQATWLRA